MRSVLQEAERFQEAVLETLSYFQAPHWIPAKAGMTYRGSTRSKAGFQTASKKITDAKRLSGRPT